MKIICIITLITSVFSVEVYAAQTFIPSLQVVSENCQVSVYENSGEEMVTPFFKLLIPTNPVFEHQVDQVLFHGVMFCYDSLLVNGVVKYFEIQGKKDIHIQKWIPAAVSFKVKNLPEVRVLLKSDVLSEEENPVDIVIPRSCLSEFRKLLLMEELQIEVSVVGKIQNEDISFQTQMVYEKDPGLPISLKAVYVSKNDTMNRLQKRVLTSRENLKSGASRFDMMSTKGCRILPKTVVAVFQSCDGVIETDSCGMSFLDKNDFSNYISFNAWFSEAYKREMEMEFFYEEIKENADVIYQKIVPAKGDDPAFLSFSFPQQTSDGKQCLGLEAEYPNGEKKLWKAPGHYPYLDLTLSSGNVNGKLHGSLYAGTSKEPVSNQSDGIIIYAHGKEKTYIRKEINKMKQRTMENSEWVYKIYPFFKMLLPEKVSYSEIPDNENESSLLELEMFYYGVLETNILMKTYGVGSVENIGAGYIHFMNVDTPSIACMTDVQFSGQEEEESFAVERSFDSNAKKNITFFVPPELRNRFLPRFEDGELNIYVDFAWGTKEVNQQLTQKVIFDASPGNLYGAEVVYVHKDVMKEQYQTFFLRSPSVGEDITETFLITASPGYEIDPETVTLLYAGKNIPVTRYSFSDPVYDGGKSFSISAWIVGSDQDDEEAELEINAYYREYDIANRGKVENKKTFFKPYLNNEVVIVPDASFDKENFYWDRSILRYKDQHRVLTIPGVLNNCTVDYDRENLKTEIHIF